MNIVAFGASSSSTSINQQLASYTANLIDSASINELDLNDFEMPIYSIDKENDTGIPELAKTFKQHLANADGIVISFAEHNGSYTSAFKNILDWISRLEGKIWLHKPMLLLATSPGGRGGQTALETAKTTFPHQGGNIIGSFSLPSFAQNFDPTNGISSPDLKTKLLDQIAALEDAIRLPS